MQEVFEMYNGGASIRSVALRFNLTIYKTTKILIEAGLHKVDSGVDKDGDRIKCIKCKKFRRYEEFNGLHCSLYICRYCGSNSKLQKDAMKQLGHDFYEQLLKKQNGGCGICKREVSWSNRHRKRCRLAIDHCHETGKIRGLLCSDCNIAIGLFRDLPELLKNAIHYLSNSTV